MEVQMFKVLDQSGNELGIIEQFNKQLPWNGRGMRPSRQWFRLQSNHSINADTKSNIASYLSKGVKYKIVKI
jgi:hypothetical protein